MDSNLLFGRVLHVDRRNNGKTRDAFEGHSSLSIFSLALLERPSRAGQSIRAAGIDARMNLKYLRDSETVLTYRWRWFEKVVALVTRNCESKLPRFRNNEFENV